ncbi:MAG TPA: hypothetical protein VKT29_07110 [Terriglobales bacterium]|nr:hypothetical protein [Terriglobales bacterium]
MGWVTQEFSRRRPEQAGGASEQDRQQAVSNTWLELRDGLRSDVAEYKRWGGLATLEAPGDDQVIVSELNNQLQLRVKADLPDRHLRYEFQAMRGDVPVPEGGFFSLHLSAAGRAELFSADQPLTCEQARRVLLQPVLFPSDTSSPLRQSA